jgi:hypothetical protein
MAHFMFTLDWNCIHAFAFEQAKGTNVMCIMYLFINIRDGF